MTAAKKGKRQDAGKAIRMVTRYWDRKVDEMAAPKLKLLSVAEDTWRRCRDSREFFEGYCKELIRTDRLIQKMKRKGK